MWRKPHMGSPREQLDRRRIKEADLEPAHIVRPGPGFGLWTTHDTLNGNERIVSAPLGDPSFKPGAVVMLGSYTGQGDRSIVASAPPGRIGAAEFTFPSGVGARADAFGIVSANPNTLPVGAVATPVALTGFGLRSTDTYRAVIYNTATMVWDTDTLITLGIVTWTSDTEVTIPISVSWSAPAGHEIRFEVLRAA